MKRTEAKPGKPIVMKLREDEEDIVCSWLNMQTVHSDSIRYLIQKEIAENGLRNLQHYIPQYRTVETLKTMLSHNTSDVVTFVQSPIGPDPSQRTESATPLPGRGINEGNYSSHSNPIALSSDAFLSNDNSAGPASPIDHGEITKSSSESMAPPKIKAKKTFGDDVTNSYAN